MVREGAPLLDHPPSHRYLNPSERAAGAAAGTRPRVPRRPLVAALLVAIVGAAGLTVILGVFLATAGTFVVSGLGGAAIGLLIAAAPLSRREAERMAISIATGMIVLAGLGVWIIARAEGGVMDPLSYLWTTFGLGLPAQALVAMLAAAWGAANGPIRWRA